MKPFALLLVAAAVYLGGCDIAAIYPTDAGAAQPDAIADAGAPDVSDAGAEAAPAPEPVVFDGGRCSEPADSGDNGIYTLECGDLPCRTCHLVPSSRPLVGCTVAAANDLCVLKCSECPRQ